MAACEWVATVATRVGEHLALAPRQMTPTLRSSWTFHANVALPRSRLPRCCVTVALTCNLGIEWLGMTTDNFLPPYKRRETQTRRGNTLQCLKLGRAVPATPEERVRQRILHWLIDVKKWPVQKIELERSWPWVGDPSRHRIRSDIELIGDKETVVVVECKAPGIPLGPEVERQAQEYALKSKAEYIWLSTGDQHKFLVRSSRVSWAVTRTLEPLAATYAPPAVSLDFPDSRDAQAVRRYFRRFFRNEGVDKYDADARYEAYAALEAKERRLFLAMHKLLFDVPKRLPFSFEGVHVLEDRGPNLHEFSNAGGGKWRGLYADYIAATSGRVEALSLRVDGWGGSRGGIRLCVGVRKAGRKHHALQMDTVDSEWVEARRCWEVYHTGRMSRVSNDTVIKAVEESGAGAWRENPHGYEGYLYLGDLHDAASADWENSKAFFANLLHYGLIRTNLREAVKARAG